MSNKEQVDVSKAFPSSCSMENNDHKQQHNPLNTTALDQQCSNTTCTTTSTRHRRRNNNIRVALLHSKVHTDVLYRTMAYVHKDRDVLVDSLLECCGFLHNTPKFFSVVSPKMASRKHLEHFHNSYYLDILENNFHITTKHVAAATQQQQQYSKENNGNNLTSLLESFGLTDDCPIPTALLSLDDENSGSSTVGGNNDHNFNNNNLLWTYCRRVVGGSIHAASLLKEGNADVAIHWGGGRHHAHTNRASGFCYVNDVVLAIQHLLLLRGHDNTNNNNSSSTAATAAATAAAGSNRRRRRQFERVLYMDIDIHHADGVQHAFYDVNTVLTVSFHRYEKGFFPSTSGKTNEKGMDGTDGVGYNLNLPLPACCTDEDFYDVYCTTLQKLVDAYAPDVIVLCVGADGLRGDPLIASSNGGNTNAGWNLTPQGLAECVRYTSELCATTTATSSTCTPAASADTGATQEQQQQQHASNVIPLLVLGGGGYHAARTARTFVLCTAAACQGARPGMLEELPRDVPRHEYFPRYAPDFVLVNDSHDDNEDEDEDEDDDGMHIGTRREKRMAKGEAYESTLRKARQEVQLTVLYLQAQRKKKEAPLCGFFQDDGDNDEENFVLVSRRKGMNRRRRKGKGSK